jgi:hypothetical protein
MASKTSAGANALSSRDLSAIAFMTRSQSRRDSYFVESTPAPAASHSLHRRPTSSPAAIRSFRIVLASMDIARLSVSSAKVTCSDCWASVAAAAPTVVPTAAGVVLINSRLLRAMIPSRDHQSASALSRYSRQRRADVRFLSKFWVKATLTGSTVPCASDRTPGAPAPVMKEWDAK